MQKSESIAKLTTSLINVQASITGAPKESENPFFKRGYADLATCWAVLREPLSKNGLAIIQTTSPTPNAICVETTLTHVSGEWISGSLVLPTVKQDPQAYGSAISYARRYALCAIVGLYQVDDDANLATHSAPHPVQLPKHVAPTSQPTHIIKAAPPIQGGLPHGDRVGGPTVAQSKRLYAIAKSHNWSDVDLQVLLKSRFGVESSRDLSKAAYEEICNVILPQGSGMGDPGPTAEPVWDSNDSQL